MFNFPDRKKTFLYPTCPCLMDFPLFASTSLPKKSLIKFLSASNEMKLNPKKTLRCSLEQKINDIISTCYRITNRKFYLSFNATPQ